MVAVVAGILLNAKRQVLIAQRPAGKSYAGYWEFPGGKIEAAETPLAALCRELQEELAIDTQAENWQLFYQGQRGEEVQIAFYLAQTAQIYQPHGLENQLWAWVTIADLPQYQFPEPNTAVLALLQSLKLKETK